MKASGVKVKAIKGKSLEQYQEWSVGGTLTYKISWDLSHQAR